MNNCDAHPNTTHPKNTNHTCHEKGFKNTHPSYAFERVSIVVNAPMPCDALYAGPFL